VQSKNKISEEKIMKNLKQNTEKQTEFNRYETFIPDSGEYNENFMYSFLNHLEEKYGIKYEVYAEGQDTGFGTEYLVEYTFPDSMAFNNGFDGTYYDALDKFNDFLQKEWFLFWEKSTGIELDRWNIANTGYDDIPIGYDCLKAIYKMKGIESNPIEDLYSIYFEDYFEGDDNQKAELIAEVENDPSLHIWKKGNIITSHVYIDGFGEGELNLND